MSYSKFREFSLISKPHHPRYFRCSLNLNNKVMEFKPNQPIECNPVKGIGLNSYYLNMRHELLSLSQLTLQERRERMKKVLIHDFLQEQKELDEVGLGLIDTQP